MDKFAWVQLVVSGVIFLAALYFYYFSARGGSALGGKKDGLKFSINKLIVAAISFFTLFAFVKTINQYYIWSANELSRLLLPPHQPIKYFIFYSFGRFWLGILIGIAVSFLFYLFLKSLEKHQSRFFVEGETELGFLMALISGWPNFVVFLALVFVFTVSLSFFRKLVLKEIYTPLGHSFFLATFFVFFFGSQVIEFLHLTVLRI